jgi:hypothetical protein
MLASNGPGRMGVPRGRSADSTARSGSAQRGKPADLRRAGSPGQGPRSAMDTHQAGDPCLTSATARAVELGLLALRAYADDQVYEQGEPVFPLRSSRACEVQRKPIAGHLASFRLPFAEYQTNRGAFYQP